MKGVRRHLTTIVLSVLAVGAAVVVLVTDRDNITTQETEHRKRNLIPMWRPDDIQSVVLATHGKTAKVKLGAPSDAGQRLWEVEIDGATFLANQQMVDQLLGTLEFATFERRVSREAVSDAELGLGSPGTVVTVEMAGKTYRIAVGGQAPSPPDARYCEAEGGVFVITAQLAAALDMRPEALRSRTFVPYLSTELKGILADGEGGARHFKKASWSGSRGAGFRFDGSTEEGDVRASAEAIDSLLGALGSLQAETFLSDDEADKAQSKRVTLTLIPKGANQPKAVIEIGGACPGKEGQIIAVRREPSRTSACVPLAVMETLTKPASEYVDLGLIGARADEVAELSITEGDKTIEIARSGGGWHERKPADRKVSSEAGNSLAKDLTELVATNVVKGELKDLGLDPPRAKVVAISSSLVPGADGHAKERIETLEVGETQGEIVHVHRKEDGAILALPSDKLPALLPAEVMLRDLAVLDLPEKDVRALTVVWNTAGNRIQKIIKGPTGWAFDGPPASGASPDLGLVEDLIDATSKLRAVRWVASKDDGTFGLSQPRFNVVLKVAGGEDGGAEKTVRIELGAVTKDGVLARTGEDPAVFVVHSKLEDAASRWLISRQAMLLDASAVVRVEGAGAKKVVAEKSGDKWTSDAGSSAAATLRDAVTDLIAEGAVSVGPPDKSFGLDKPRATLTVVAEPEQGAPKGSPRRTFKITFGAGDSYRGTSIVYARRDDIDATFAVAQGKVRALFEVLEVP